MRKRILCLTLFLAGLPGFGQEPQDLDLDLDWNWIRQQVHEWVPVLEEEFDVQLDIRDVDGWLLQLRHLEQVIRTGTLQDLSDWAPMAREAHRAIADVQEWTPYADWLFQRLDYTDLARFLILGQRTPAPGPRAAPAPPRPPPNQNVLWQNRMRARPAPRTAEALVPMLKPVFERRGVPPEWVWIAEVESSFNPEARSPVGAVGLFQFMPRTGESLGLELSPVDQRTDPEKSADAAARYLRQLYGRFQDWPLVLAAYNAGQGRVSGLMRRHGNSFEAIAPHLPTETRMYVPKVLAAVQAREGVDGRTLPAPR
ncbi:MAG: lytic transglycosylase domain-containing protein [Verrucomicrobia bacterium]|nr:lytic transglycosylase domain-containing protein [Verrucomicrobiota bacterium]MCH8526691.1 lytic transglycosylase domain-containing protein [Kiritimatiellia bacterium]